MSQVRKKYKKIRIKFKRVLRLAMNENKALAMMAIETYVSKQCRNHIAETWNMLRDYPRARKYYNDNLLGKHLTGKSEIFHSLYFSENNIYNEFYRKIPEQYAMGDSLAVAYSVLKKNKGI